MMSSPLVRYADKASSVFPFRLIAFFLAMGAVAVAVIASV
jgi:hypothetical protein